MKLKLLILTILFCVSESLFAQGTQISGSSQIKDHSITNIKISDSANILWSKLDFTGFNGSVLGLENPLIFTSPLIRTLNTITLGTVPVSKGGTGLTSITAGYIPFGVNSTNTGIHGGLVWDNTAHKLVLSGLQITGGSSLNGKVLVSDNVGNVTLQTFDVLAAGGIPLTQKGAINGVASLDGSGLIPQNQLPQITITDTYVVASQAAMLALSAQTGDIAVRTDLSKSFILTADTPTVLGAWQWLLSPTSDVVNVFGRTGSITATAGDYTATLITNTPAGNIAAVTVQTALNELDTEKAPLASPSFSTLLSLTGVYTQTSASATAFESGPNGATNPTFRLDNSTGSAVTGLSITGKASGSGVDLSVISPNTNDSISIKAKGSGSIRLYGAGSSTPYYQFTANTGAYTQVAGTCIGWTSSATDATQAQDTCISRLSAGTVSFDTSSAGDGLGNIKAATVGSGRFYDGTTANAGFQFVAGIPAITSTVSGVGIQVFSTAIAMSSDISIGWRSGNDMSSGFDTQISRLSAGVVSFDTSSAGNGLASISVKGTVNRFGTLTTAYAKADTALAPSATGQLPLLIQGKAGSTEDLFQIQKSTGAKAVSVAVLNEGGAYNPTTAADFRIGIDGTGAAGTGFDLIDTTTGSSRRLSWGINNTAGFALAYGVKCFAYDGGTWLKLPTATGLMWSGTSDPTAASTSGISQLSAGVISFDTTTVGDSLGSAKMTGISLLGKTTTYSNVTTAGWGVPAIYGAGRATAQTAANASVSTYTVGAADGSFEVSANALVTTSSAENFTITCTYTDEGNTSRTLTLNFQTIAGVMGTAINFSNGAVPYEGVLVHIRAKASTTITIATTGTFTGATYNVEGIIKQTK